MASVYKNLTSQDIAIVPFNAHKQYNYSSASAAANQITYSNTIWTSESIDVYSSGALDGVYPSLDTIGTIKYQQLDHLFYRDFRRNILKRLGNVDYLNQPRVLYQRANILSIPSGLVGSQIKPGSFYLSSSRYEVVDDSKGNLYISGSNLNNWETDVRSNIFKLGPVKGFKKYDLNTISEEPQAGVWWRRGRKKVNLYDYYSTPEIGDQCDDSYYNNLIKYTEVQFKPQKVLDGNMNAGFPIYAANASIEPYHLSARVHTAVWFTGSKNSFIKADNNKNFHFNKGDDFTINFFPRFLNSNNGTVLNTPQYYFSKSTTETIIPSPSSGQAGVYKTSTTGALQTIEANSAPQFPFEIYLKNDLFNKPCFYFDRFDGTILSSVSASFHTSSVSPDPHYTFRCSASKMEIFKNGIQTGTTTTDTSIRETQNNANVYIGCKGGKSNYINRGSISELNVYNKALTNIQIENHYSSSDGSPYIGNIFYQTGITSITKPYYLGILSGSSLEGAINTLQFQGTHLIYENEYQCTAEEHEFNDTLNISARKLRNTECPDVANFTTSSLFKPYVSTIGLYDENHELLVVGKLGQPTKMSDETDTTFVLRWDT